MNHQSENIRNLDNLLVIKFGGKAISSPKRIRHLAERVSAYHNERPTLVVVSAMGDDTNRLIKLADQASGGICQSDDLTQIVAFGENLSANLFTTALKSMGLNSVAVTPNSKYWPIFGESIDDVKLSREKINQQVCVKIFEEYSKNRAIEGIGNLLLNRTIPVVSGFLAKTKDGDLITLGRGGSDTSAFFLGKILGAKDLIIVTDVDGVMKADPRRVDQTTSVNLITVDEMDSVARSGGQILHPQSLAFKTDNMNARIVSFDEPDYTDSGTELVGFYKAHLKGIRKKLALVTLVAEEPGTQKNFWTDIALIIAKLDISLYGLSLTESYVSFYVSDDQTDEFYNELSSVVKKKPFVINILQRRNVARLNLSSHENAENPSMISDICDILIERGIRVYEVITCQSDISVFVDWDHRQKADKLFKRIATDINLRNILSSNDD